MSIHVPLVFRLSGIPEIHILAGLKMKAGRSNTSIEVFSAQLFRYDI